MEEYTAAGKSTGDWFTEPTSASADPPQRDLFRDSILKGMPVFKGPCGPKHKAGSTEGLSRSRGTTTVYSAGGKRGASASFSASSPSLAGRKTRTTRDSSLTVDLAVGRGLVPRVAPRHTSRGLRDAGRPTVTGMGSKSATAGAPARRSAVAGAPVTIPFVV